jgi:hypothetical protein
VKPTATAPAAREPVALVAATPFETTSTAVALVPNTLESAFALAGWLAQAKTIKGDLQNKPHDVLTLLLAGAELGLPPMASIRGLYVVNGRPALEAKTKSAICLQRGAALYFKKTEDTEKAVTWETLRAGATSPALARFTMEEAELTRKMKEIAEQTKFLMRPSDKGREQRGRSEEKRKEKHKRKKKKGMKGI